MSTAWGRTNSSGHHRMPGIKQHRAPDNFLTMSRGQASASLDRHSYTTNTEEEKHGEPTPTGHKRRHYSRFALFCRSSEPLTKVCVGGSGGGGGTLILSCLVGLDPASTVTPPPTPKKISGITDMPKKYLKFKQPQKILSFCTFDKRP